MMQKHARKHWDSPTSTKRKKRENKKVKDNIWRTLSGNYFWSQVLTVKLRKLQLKAKSITNFNPRIYSFLFFQIIIIVCCEMKFAIFLKGIRSSIGLLKSIQRSILYSDFSGIKWLKSKLLHAKSLKVNCISTLFVQKCPFLRLMILNTWMVGFKCITLKHFRSHKNIGK